GRVWTVVMQSSSQFEMADGAKLTWEEALAHITEGDLLRVKGKRDRERNTVAAQRITLLGSALTAPTRI
ncbi:MAG: hypothetical protein ACRDID_18730, partial [Ktedonobacterales bacterium]